MRTKGEIAQDLFRVARRLFQVQALSQPVGADDGIVIGKPQLHDGVPADETALARRHLFAHHAAVATAEQVDQAVARDCLGAQRGCPVERLALAVQELLQTAQRRVIKSFSSG